MELKFLEIKYDKMSVDVYKAKFIELSRFVPEFVNTKEKKARRFQQGLKQWIQDRVSLLEITDYVQKGLDCRGRNIPMRKNNHTYGSRNFLEINRFYERFVQDFAKISGPLTRPTCKMEKVVWNEKCEESFQELKRSLVTALVLALPDGKGDL
ncbi:hypothetical protein AgCh_017500 [Apium graveolens]